MKLLIRTMRDKYGSRQHVIFTDVGGISSPLCMVDDIAVSEFIEMYYAEQEEMDRAMNNSREVDNE